jgi:hypothetical protein
MQDIFPTVYFSCLPFQDHLARHQVASFLVHCSVMQPERETLSECPLPPIYSHTKIALRPEAAAA